MYESDFDARWLKEVPFVDHYDNNVYVWGCSPQNGRRLGRSMEIPAKTNLPDNFHWYEIH